MLTSHFIQASFAEKRETQSLKFFAEKWSQFIIFGTEGQFISKNGKYCIDATKLNSFWFSIVSFYKNQQATVSMILNQAGFSLVASVRYLPIIVKNLTLSSKRINWDFFGGTTG